MPNTVNLGRFTADHRGPITVFIIGMRINKFRCIDKWLSVARAMGPMIAELSAQPESRVPTIMRMSRDRSPPQLYRHSG